MKQKRTAIIVILGLGLLASPVVAADRDGPHGHIYGTVKTDSDRTYTGLLRWGTEETFWDDLFNSSKDDLPYLKDHARDKRRRNRIKVFGITVGYRWDGSGSSRMFIARFGDIDRIEMGRGQHIEVTMKDGSVFDMEGGSNDVGATITVWDDALGEVKLDWDNVESVDFRATPAGIEPPGYRLYGKVYTEDAGTFEGYVQWDVQECLSIDELDGETDDGDLSIAMGKIRAIEKRNRKGSHVELKDGRKFVLEGTNDVDSSLRGINLEDPRFGRVKISWEAFERVEFERVDSTGRGYDDYHPPGKLKGTVTDYDGRSHAGRIVFDLDEEAGWELLNGSADGVEYNIPFSMIRSVEPRRGDESKLVLKNGEELTLGEGQDVSENNDGVVVLRDNDRETYFAWDEIKRVEFD